MLTRLQCDNKTFGDDFDEFWWFDVCIPDPSFDVDPAAMWQQDLWWWFWWFDVCVPHPSFDVDPAAMWQQDLWWWFWWILMIWCLCSSSFFWCWPGCNVTTRPLVMILMNSDDLMFVFLILLLMLARLPCDNQTFGDDFDEFWWFDVCVPHPSFDVDSAAMWHDFDDLMFVFLILLLMLTRLQCDNKTFGDDFAEFWWFDVCVPHPSFDVDPAAMWQQDLWWWFWWILMIWCLCSSSFFWCWPGCNVTTRPLVMILMIFDDLMIVFLILVLMLTRLPCDNKTFVDDFDEFWWFDVCVPHPSFDVDPAAMWRHDLWWWFWWLDVCVPHPSFDVGPAAMWQQDLWWWFWWFDVCVPHPSFDVEAAAIWKHAAQRELSVPFYT